MASILDRVKRGWNAFLGRDPTRNINGIGVGSSFRPDLMVPHRGYERTILNSIYCKISSDVAAIRFEHVRLDDNGNYKETIKSGLNNCLTLDPNLDQTGRDLLQEIVMCALEDGCAAIVPTDVTANPYITDSYDVIKMRVGRVTQWYPKHVTVEVYNEDTGKREQITLAKEMVAIVTNPFRAITNEPNSTLQRLINAINRLDHLDQQNSSGRLDLLFRLPYALKGDMKREQAAQRKKDIEDQLYNSPHGFAFIDSTEQVIQLNRPVENTLWDQVNTLTQQIYEQFGITRPILDGTASEEQMLNYYNSTIEPFCAAIADAITRRFISKTARTRGHAIHFFRNTFKLVPVKDLAEIGDKMTRNEIMSSNELRAEIGLKPVDDPRADELRNKNLNQSNQELAANPVTTNGDDTGGGAQILTGLLEKLGNLKLYNRKAS